MAVHLMRAMAAGDLVSEWNKNDLQKVGFQRTARTDKGVSACSQVVNARLLLRPDQEIVARFNAHLPEDIRVFGTVAISLRFLSVTHASCRGTAILQATKGFDCKRLCDARQYLVG
jgi:tRNA pseudouridine38-40 synthase